MIDDLVCSKCDTTLNITDNIMEIHVEDDTAYVFCLNCVKLGFSELNKKKDMNKAEMDLMMGLRDFLKRHHQISIS